MNELQVNQLIAALLAQNQVLSEQTAAIDRLAQSNNYLAQTLVETLAEEAEGDDVGSPSAYYLNGQPIGEQWVRGRQAKEIAVQQGDEFAQRLLSERR